MKSTVSLVLKIVHFAVNVSWYINLVLFAVALTFLTWKFSTSDFSEFSAEVKVRSNAEVIKMSAAARNAADVRVMIDQGKLTMNLKNTVSNMALAYFFLISFEALIITIIYQFRKFFLTLRNRQPFAMENVRRLKLIALCFALINIIHSLIGISTWMILKENVAGYDKLFMVWNESFNGFIWGAAIYISADIFKYGVALKKENEEFV